MKKQSIRFLALLLAMLMLTGVCAAAEPQISAEGLAMMGVLDPKSDLKDLPVLEDSYTALMIRTAFIASIGPT